jgi:hypothetical protein
MTRALRERYPNTGPGKELKTPPQSPLRDLMFAKLGHLGNGLGIPVDGPDLARRGAPS